MSLLFALIRETSLLAPGDLRHLCWPLEQNGKHCATAWGLEPPAIIVADRKDLLPRYAHPIVFTDDKGDPGALAVHYYDPVRGGPAAIVYVDRASGFNTGSYSVTESASHEVVEALVNPRLNLWQPHPDPARVGVQVAREVADPTQDTYFIESRGTRWKVTNFVTPAWFDAAARDPLLAERVRAGGGFDHAKRLSRPGEIGSEGYVILRERNEHGWVMWFEDASGQRFGSAPTKTARANASKRYDNARTRVLARGSAT